MTKTLELDGSRVHDIPSLYGELNRIFMRDETWALGPSLDALDDLLYGGFGAIDGDEPVRLVWRDHELSRHALGRDVTIEHYRRKLRQPEVFNARTARAAVAELEAGGGTTYFDLVVQVVSDHPNIELVLA